jgi:uncharacterized protein (DUF58 family)
MILPTPRAVKFFSISAPVALLLVATRPGAWYFSLYYPAIVLALILADIIRVVPNGRLEAALSVPRQLAVGSRISADVSISFDGGESLRVEALLEMTGDADPPAAIAGDAEGGRLSLRIPVVPRRRGQVTIDALWLRWRGPLGLVEIRRRQPAGDVINVVPNVSGIHHEALQFFLRDAEYGVKSQRMKGESSEFESLCEYAQGMDYRLIDWRSSARHRKILCKEFRQERNHHVVLGFDTGRLMLEPIDGTPKLDRAVRAGLMLGWVSLYNGDLLGGCGFDVRFRNFIQPGRGMPYFARFQRFAAELAYRTEETNFTLGLAELNSRLRRRSLVVLFTDFVDVISAELLIESLTWMVRRHVVIFVTLRDPMLARLASEPPDSFTNVAGAVIAYDFLRERSVVLERMARLGVHCLDVPAGGVSSALLNRYLLIKQRGLI